jgi:hypothetical protein
MNKWNFFKVVGFVVAVALIVFGGVDNFLRTIRFGMERWLKS